MSKFTIRGGNSGYFSNGFVFSDSESACPRRIYLRAHDIQPKVDGKSINTFALGHLNESFFDLPFKYAEKEVSEPVTELTSFTGHVDFITSTNMPYELKSASSTNTYAKVFKKGIYKSENLFQLAHYMLTLESDTGKLVYISYLDKINYKTIETHTPHEITALATESSREKKIFNVKFEDSGEITVDGNSTGKNVQGLLDFRGEVARMFEEDILPVDRPLPTEIGGAGPCFFCNFKPVCTEFERNRFSNEEFLNKARDIVK